MEFKELEQYLDSLSELENIPGCDCIIYHGHEMVFRHMAGYSDVEKTKPVSEKDRYMLYSATKVLTATAAMQLVEKGLLRLEDPLSRYLPEFAHMYVGERPAEVPITIEHLLTMRAGFDYNVNMPSIQRVIKADPKASTAQIVSAIAENPLSFEPGTHFQYSLCHDVLARVIEVVSGMKFGEYMKANLFDPLGMEHSGFSIEEAKEFLTRQYEANPETKELRPVAHTNFSVMTPCYESGGAGLVSTVEDYGRFVEAMCNYGVSASGKRILQAESIDLMRKNRMDEVCMEDFKRVNKIGYGYGLGVRTLIEKEMSGAKSPIGEFGWDGAAGAYVMIDVENKIGIFYAQQVLARDVANIIHTRIRNMVYDWLEGQR